MGDPVRKEKLAPKVQEPKLAQLKYGNPNRI
jgi:hypothetical protein